MIQRGNSKLGAQTHAFYLPAGLTCPGQTPICASNCYAKKRFFKSGCVKKSHANNYAESLKPSFVASIVADISRLNSKIVRVHVSGDFYDAGYVRKWIRIAEQSPQTTFYAYTRSWRMKRMMRALLELADLPNFQLWWSVDKDTDDAEGRPPKHAGIQVAYMQVEHDERIPKYTDLVFRVKRDTLAKFVDGRLVCLAENGMTYVNKMTCTRCNMCASSRAIPRKKPATKDLVTIK